LQFNIEKGNFKNNKVLLFFPQGFIQAAGMCKPYVISSLLKLALRVS